MILPKHYTQISMFAVAGVAGFIVDAAIVTLLTRTSCAGPLASQMVGFSVAVTVTWLINRNLAFANHAKRNMAHELATYVAANSLGAVINNGVYSILIITMVLFSKNPVLAVAGGSLAGMIFNFTVSKVIVFTE